MLVRKILALVSKSNSGVVGKILVLDAQELFQTCSILENRDELLEEKAIVTRGGCDILEKKLKTVFGNFNACCSIDSSPHIMHVPTNTAIMFKAKHQGVFCL